jgi:hypothetical protein
MSDITYLAIQGAILICYASWIAYRVGFSKGQQHMEIRLNDNQHNT